MHAPLLADLVVLLVVSIGVLYISHVARIPGIVGFLLSGVIVGPHGFGLVRQIEEVEQLAEIGVILLLFTIGLEISLKDLARMRRLVLVGGSLQVGLVTALVFVVLRLAGMEGAPALFLGMTASLSSTAVVLTLLQQRQEIDAPQGRMGLSILVYQDVMIVPMMLLIPVLAGSSEGGLGSALVSFVGKSVAVLLGLAVLGRWVVPRLLGRVVHTRNHDLFLLTVVGVCLAVAWGAGEAGLSLALGAFLAGILISESEYSHQALADVVPLRDLFAAFFFISIGMLLDLGLVVRDPLFLGALIVGLLVLKIVSAGAATLALGFSARTSVQTGLSLAQVGEFSFVLASAGMAAGLMTETTHQWFVVAAVATIGATPLLMWISPSVAAWVDHLPLPRAVRTGRLEAAGPEAAAERSGHVIVIGYGVNGKNVSRAAAVAGIPYVAVDTNPAVVEAERAQGVEIRHGDATRPALMEHLGARRAHAVVIAVSDAAATRRITALVRSLNPTCVIVTRTRYVREVDVLHGLGATIVIPEELETSIEIVSRLLQSYLIPKREIDTFVAEIRAGSYQMLRSPAEPDGGLYDLRDALSDVEVATLRVEPGCAIEGMPLADTDLRRLYGVNVVAIRRGEELLPNPHGEETVHGGDLLVVLGLGEEIAAASQLLRAQEPSPE